MPCMNALPAGPVSLWNSRRNSRAKGRSSILSCASRAGYGSNSPSTRASSVAASSDFPELSASPVRERLYARRDSLDRAAGEIKPRSQTKRKSGLEQGSAAERYDLTKKTYSQYGNAGEHRRADITLRPGRLSETRSPAKFDLKTGRGRLRANSCAKDTGCL